MVSQSRSKSLRLLDEEQLFEERKEQELSSLFIDEQERVDETFLRALDGGLR